jgi:hypothetical protein
MQETPHRVAVVMPFVERQTDKVVECIGRWTDRPPFSDDVRLSNVRDQIDLVFYYHRAPDLQPQSSRDAILAALDALPDNGRFFHRHRVFFWYANLTAEEDVYPMGANLMFYNLFERSFGELSRDSRRYLFLMESDVRPLRANWMNKVYNESLGSPFWVRGSQFHGRYLPSHFRLHINGNALYGVHDAEFVELLKRVKASWSLSMGYDNCIGQFLVAEQNYQYWYDYIHMYQYADFIRNMHWTDYSFADFERRFPNTFLVHNGNNTDAPHERTEYTKLPEKPTQQ